MARPNVAVNCIIAKLNNQVLLTRRNDNKTWCLPGGMVEFGESIEEAIEREILEEVNLQIQVIRCTGIYSQIPNKVIKSPAKGPLIIICFACKIIGGEPSISDEVDEIKYFNADSLPSDIIQTHVERIKDAFLQLKYTVIK